MQFRPTHHSPDNVLGVLLKSTNAGEGGLGFRGLGLQLYEGTCFIGEGVLKIRGRRL